VPIPIVCSGCSARVAAPDTAAGKTLRCPKCQTALTVPAPAAGFEVIEEPKPAPPKSPTAAKATATPKPRPAVVGKYEDDGDDRPRKKRATAEEDGDDRPRRKRPVAGDEDEDEDDRPRKISKKRRQKPGMAPAVLFGGIAAAVLLLGGGGFAGYWFAVREKPQETAGSGGGSPNAPSNPSSPASQGGDGSRAPVPTGWKEVVPPRGGFRAHMPVVPFGADFAPVKPLAGAKEPTIANYGCMSPDNNLQCLILVFGFPDTMPAADREKAVVARMQVGVPREFVKELSRGKSALGGKEATEIVEEVAFAAALGGKGPNGGRVAEKLVAVTRYCFVGNRAYLAEIVRVGGRPSEAEEKGFFDNFELIPESGPGGSPEASITRSWSDFTAPEGFGFRARFPWSAPQTPPSPLAPPEGSTSADQFQVQYSEPGGILTHFAVVVVRFKPGLPPAGREKTLDDLVRLMRLPPELKASSPKPVVWAGRPATEVVYEMAQPGANGRKTRVVMRRLITEAGAYVAYVREHGGILLADLTTFFDSFALTK
jgi:hypothetical protein